MTVIPSSTPALKAHQIFMPPTSPASSPPPPTSSAVPFPVPDRTSQSPASSATTQPPSNPHPTPTLRLEIRSLSHPGATKFLTSVTASTLLSNAVRNVQTHLYTSPPSTTHCPPTRSVTVILRDIGGVAYTTGTELDPSHHKEIHFSLNYISSITPSARLAAEIEGVLTHELVHCYQHNAQGTCPGGLIEGVADWVRLCCRLGPPHWKRETGGTWDAGYQHTAYFLQYLEERFGAGTVRRINERLRGRRYEEKQFWTGLLGRPVGQLWGDYVEKVKCDEEDGSGKGPGDGRGKSSAVDEGTQTA